MLKFPYKGKGYKMFDNLSEKLQSIISKTHSQELTQDNMQEALREIRRALLEADVNLRVVKSFISSIKDKAEGENVLQGVNPSQQLVKIVHDELVELLGHTPIEVVMGAIFGIVEAVALYNVFWS